MPNISDMSTGEKLVRISVDTLLVVLLLGLFALPITSLGLMGYNSPKQSGSAQEVLGENAPAGALPTVRPQPRGTLVVPDAVESSESTTN